MNIWTWKMILYRKPLRKHQNSWTIIIYLQQLYITVNQPYLQYVFVNLKLSSEMPKWKHVLFTFVLLKWSCSLMVLHWHRCWKIYISKKWTKKISDFIFIQSIQNAFYAFDLMNCNNKRCEKFTSDFFTLEKLNKKKVALNRASEGITNNSEYEFGC